MKVSLGMPYWGQDPTRYRNFQYVWPLMKALYPWHQSLSRVPIEIESRGGARNHLVKSLAAGGADVVVLCDADTFVDEDALLCAIGRASVGGLHFAFDTFRYLDDHSTVRLILGEYSDLLDLDCVMEGPGSLGGCMVIRPEEWVAAGESPELDGWGFEDVIFAVQARNLLSAPTSWAPGRLHHLYHPSECYVGSVQYERNIAVCQRFESVDGDAEAVRRLISERTADMGRLLLRDSEGGK